MTLEELIALYESDKERYELLFGSDFVRLVNKSDMSEIHRVEDDRCSYIAIALLIGMMPCPLDTGKE